MTDSELLQALYSDMQSMKQDMQSMKQDMQSVNQDMQSMKQDMQSMKQDMQSMKQDMQNLDQRLSTIDDKVTNVKLTLENEIRVNIQRVAEGHFDLSRNLYEAMKPADEVTVLAIKVRQLESEVRELKRKIS